MDKKYKKICTEVGYIEAKRNAIYLDTFEQKGNTINLFGEIASRWCEKKISDYKWYKYHLTFMGVKKYDAINIEDYYKKNIKTESTFSEVINVPYEETKCKTLIIETYDWAYIVVCENFEFAIIDYR